ncbi:MAG: two-component regulator propeller domain-containing protein, partial [Cytophagaceae bacterium]
MPKNWIPLFIFLYIFSFTKAFSVDKPYLIFQNLDKSLGLNETIVRTISEDEKGFMWFGSEHGLFKYDGRKISTYKSAKDDIYSISSSDIKFIFSDSRGRIWIGTRSGLNLYDRIKDYFLNYNNTEFKCLEKLNGDFQSITEDRYGNIWVTVENEGLYKISSLGKEPENYRFTSPNYKNLFIGLAADTNGNIWVGTDNGLLKFNAGTHKFKDLREKYGNGYQVNKILSDKEEMLWLATSEGLKVIDNQGNLKSYKYDPNNPNGILGNNVTNIHPYKKNQLLISIDGSGLDIFDSRNELFYHYTDDGIAQLPCKNLTTVFNDRNNNIWVGTFMHGIAYSNSTTNLFALYRNNKFSGKNIHNGIVTHFIEDKEKNLWIATDGGGLYIIPKGEKYPKPYEPVPGKGNLADFPIVSLIEDSKGYIWLATYSGGLKRITPGKPEVLTYQHETDNPLSLKNNKLRSIYEDDEGNIWVSGFSSGIGILDINTNNFKHYYYNAKDSLGIPSNWVQT